MKITIQHGASKYQGTLANAIPLKDFPPSEAAGSSSFCIAQCFLVPQGGPLPGVSYAAGMSNVIEIGPKEIELFLRLNNIQSLEDPKAAWSIYQWVGGSTPRLYSFLEGQDKRTATGLRWPVMYFPSAGPYVNKAIVSERRLGLAHLEGIPKADDYSDIQIGDPRVMLATCYYKYGAELGLAPISYPEGARREKIYVPFWKIDCAWNWRSKGGDEAWMDETWLV